MTVAQAAGKLAPTDWQVIKATEVADYTVPSEVTTYRAAVRTASNTIESAINGAADHDAFDGFVMTLRLTLKTVIQLVMLR